MTRFARAKGSKASNERTPEDGTPWEVMKEQLLKAKQESEEMKKREKAEKQRIENYEKFLMEQKIQKRKATWCDFPDPEPKNNYEKATAVTVDQSPKKKKKRKHNNDNTEESNKDINMENSLNKSRKKNKEASEQCVTSITCNNSEQPPKKKKKKNKNKTSDYDKPDKDQSPNVSNTLDKSDNIVSQKKKQKSKIHNKSTQQVDNTEENINDHKYNIGKPLKKKKTKFTEGRPVRRKELNDSFHLIINGKEVELTRFDGFPIIRKDAERLAELKKSMIKKGIPKSEVQRTIKLERRRAEKALARLKRDVCYNCRKGGHNLSDCPDLKSKIPGVDAPDGLCFKCGSTEHRQSECKVQRDKEFRFATCFICKEAGHIARQCPDNPKGLYPNGGCCKLCGDVTHLRKDCPTTQSTKEGTSVKLQTLDSNENIEDIGLQEKTSYAEDSVKKPKKIRF